MRVYIGPYTNWLGPYQLANKIPFLSEDTKDKIGKWLCNTWLNDFCIWLDSKKHRKIKIHIDNYDTWNVDHTLALITLPLLKRLKETKIGSPIVDDEDVPEHMRYSDPQGSEWGPDNWVHYKWEWILNELIWTFEQLVNKDADGVWEKFIKDKEFCDRVDNGLRLFGKYYQNLWD